MLHYDVIETDWGPFVAVITEHGLVQTTLPERRNEADRTPRPIGRWQDAHYRKNAVPGLRRDLTAYFAGEPAAFDFPLDGCGMTEFRQSVTQAARRIPHGSTATYSDLARNAGRPRASRAVGTIMANNPLPLIVPCHRVVRADGTIGGFSSRNGVATKRRLLALEKKRCQDDFWRSKGVREAKVSG